MPHSPPLPDSIAGSTELLTRHLATELAQRGVQNNPGAADETYLALHAGVQHLRSRGLSEHAIREHLARTFLTFRQRLFSPSEQSPSAFWTIFEYIGGLPLI